MGNDFDKWSALIATYDSVHEAAHKIGCGISTLWRWRNGGPMDANDYDNICNLMRERGIEPISLPKPGRKK